MSNENTVQAKVLRPFEGDEGTKWPGDQVEITRQRFADLKANGLVEEVGEKAAPAPQNKMEAAPVNKTVEAPKRK